MLKKVFVSLCLGVALLVGGMVVQQPVWAAGDVCSDPAIDDEAKKAAGCNLATNDTAVGFVNGLIQVILGLVGVIAVAVIIIGGFLYATSTGDAAKVNRAKHAIIYGVVGLIVTLLAYAIVNFVIKAI